MVQRAYFKHNEDIRKLYPDIADRYPPQVWVSPDECCCDGVLNTKEDIEQMIAELQEALRAFTEYTS